MLLCRSSYKGLKVGEVSRFPERQPVSTMVTGANVVGNGGLTTTSAQGLQGSIGAHRTQDLGPPCHLLSDADWCFVGFFFTLL